MNLHLKLNELSLVDLKTFCLIWEWVVYSILFLGRRGEVWIGLNIFALLYTILVAARTEEKCWKTPRKVFLATFPVYWKLYGEIWPPVFFQTKFSEAKRIPVILNEDLNFWILVWNDTASDGETQRVWSFSKDET